MMMIMTVLLMLTTMTARCCQRLREAFANVERQLAAKEAYLAARAEVMQDEKKKLFAEARSVNRTSTGHHRITLFYWMLIYVAHITHTYTSTGRGLSAIQRSVKVSARVRTVVCFLVISWRGVACRVWQGLDSRGADADHRAARKPKARRRDRAEVIGAFPALKLASRKSSLTLDGARYGPVCWCIAVLGLFLLSS
jgi:hypothetical protein